MFIVFLKKKRGGEKTTAIRMIISLISVDSGEILINYKSVIKK